MIANNATITKNSPAARTKQLRGLLDINAKLRRQYHRKGLTILCYRCGLNTERICRYFYNGKLPPEEVTKMIGIIKEYQVK